MLTDLAAPILDLVARYGVAALFVFLILDAAMLLPLVPGELLLILAINQFAGSFLGLAFVVVLATVAATLGSLLLYSFARAGGRRFIQAHPRLFFMSASTRDRMERLFQRPAGQSLVLILRMFPFVRLLVSLPAGLARMPTLRYTILTGIGHLLYNVGFLWLAFESRKPDSTVSNSANFVRDSYASPAWNYVQTNWILTFTVLLGLGIFFSLRSSVKIARNPGEAPPASLLGSLANAALFWGGLGLLVGLWMDPPAVYDAIALSGHDLRLESYGLPYEPLSLVAGAGAAAILFSILLSSLRRSARHHARAARPASFKEEVRRQQSEDRP